MAADEKLQWHRWFGLGWADLLAGRPFSVQMERDMSVKKQLLDVVVIRRDMGVPLPDDLPDGFDDLGPHNLISFKSYQEAFDAEAVVELLSHFNAYRKQEGKDDQHPLAMEQCRLYAACVRSPQELKREPRLIRCGPGVYELPILERVSIRLVVCQELPATPRNALLHLFAFNKDAALYGATTYQPRSQQTSSFMGQLVRRYSREGWTMPYTVQQANREFAQELWNEMTPEERLEVLEKMPPEKRTAGLPVEKLLEGIPAEQLLKGIPTEKRLEGLSLDDRLKDLSPEELEELRRRFGGK
ncbi:MAG: hypothetical protein K2W96_09560 [Gemmataceae bacterium]|nr:hypothetical protein [Gemmataceae bacterium]